MSADVPSGFRRQAAWLAALLLIAPGTIAAQHDTAEPSVVEKLAALEAGQATLLGQMEALASTLSDLRSLLPSPATNARMLRGVLPSDPVALTWAHVKGSPRAKVVVIEYSDFQCPYCANFFRNTFPKLDARYVESQTVQFAYWNLPLIDIHPRALRAAESAECAADQGRFWEMHDRLFSDPTRLDDASLLDRARTLSLDLSQFADCLDSNETARRVREQASAAARLLQTAGTPTFLLGTRQAGGTVKALHRLDGARDFGAFEDAIDGLLEARG